MKVVVPLNMQREGEVTTVAWVKPEVSGPLYKPKRLGYCMRHEKESSSGSSRQTRRLSYEQGQGEGLDFAPEEVDNMVFSLRTQQVTDAENEAPNLRTEPSGRVSDE